MFGGLHLLIRLADGTCGRGRRGRYRRCRYHSKRIRFAWLQKVLIPTLFSWQPPLQQQPRMLWQETSAADRQTVCMSMYGSLRLQTLIQGCLLWAACPRSLPPALRVKGAALLLKLLLRAYLKIFRPLRLG